MILAKFENAMILDKPSGMSTHTPDGGLTPGFVEVAEQQLGSRLWAAHRLDRDTSGCLLCPTSAEAVDVWSKNLKSAIKKYFFISQHESEKSVWSFEGRIEKVGSHKFDLVEGEPNSHTTFARIGRNVLGHLYEAEISTGKTHQIRIHAQKSGIPIWGDSEREKSFGVANPLGSFAPRLFLHAKELIFDGEKYFSSLPHSFLHSQETEREFLKLGTDEKIAALKFLVSTDRRRFLISQFQSQNTDAFRVCHREWFHDLDVCLEKHSQVLQVLNYLDQIQLKKKLSIELLEFISRVTNCEHWILKHMNNRGKKSAISELDNTSQQTSKNLPLQWPVSENGVKFDIRYNHGMNSGIFLDQRENRKEIREISHGKKVLNLFSYTCGFSVCAALGGASEVVSVDTSPHSLEWGKKNFSLNQLQPERYEFFTADALFFLESCKKRDRHFDIIVLDPPTFSRGKKGIFKLREKLEELVYLSLVCLEHQGILLLTFNDEELDLSTAAGEVEKAAQKAGVTYMEVKKIRPPLDFEFPLERETVFKGFWLEVVKG